MSIIVKGMEMPKSCFKCFIKQGSCPAIRKRIQVLPANSDTWIPYDYRHDDCPLGNVPTPHGRLIDEEVVLDHFVSISNNEWNQNVCTSWANAFAEASSDICDIPTVIEAEE